MARRPRARRRRPGSAPRARVASAGGARTTARRARRSRARPICSTWPYRAVRIDEARAGAEQRRRPSRDRRAAARHEAAERGLDARERAHRRHGPCRRRSASAPPRRARPRAAARRSRGSPRACAARRTTSPGSARAERSGAPQRDGDRRPDGEEAQRRAHDRRARATPRSRAPGRPARRGRSRKRAPMPAAAVETRAASAAASRRRGSRRRGIRKPAMPIIRMNGIGSATSVSSPIATAAPGEQHGAAGRLHRPDDRVVDVVRPRRAPRGSGRRRAASSRSRCRGRRARSGSSRRSASRRSRATQYMTPSAPVIVHAAKTNGIVTATEKPNTASSTSSAIGTAMLSPFVRSCAKIGSRSCWVGPAPVT